MMILWLLVSDFSFLELVAVTSWSDLLVSVLEWIGNVTIAMLKDDENVLFLASEPILSWIVRRKAGDNFRILRSDKYHWERLDTAAFFWDRSRAKVIKLLFKIIQAPVTIELSWFCRDFWTCSNLQTRKTFFSRLNAQTHSDFDLIF
jgi:hypothetical protein